VVFFRIILPFVLLTLNLYGYHRSSSYPYLSGDTWRFFCDWVLSDTQNFNPGKVACGDTIFVEYFSLDKFRKEYLPNIKEKFILITPNSENGSDNPLPGPYDDMVLSENLAAWFLQNIDRAPTEKIIPIPIFLANNFWPWGNTKLLDKYIPKARSIKQADKKILAYVNFSVSTNCKVRVPCLNYFKSQPYTLIRSNISFETYLQHLCLTQFVVSPFGNGMDCHRTWEALLMGCYPIVLSSHLVPLYEDLPVVVVNRWEDVTQEFLLQKQIEFESKNWSVEKLYAPYWFNKVKKIQDELRN
jgi:hypothetical protein